MPVTTPVSKELADLYIGAKQSTAKAPVKQLGKDEFLKLLTFQLKSQNPMKPSDSSQFASQLAQFSSLEQLTNINKSITDQLASNTMLVQTLTNTTLPGLIGKSARLQDDTVALSGGKAEKFGYTLGDSASEIEATIVNANGVTVRTLSIPTDGKELGDHELSWDGKDSKGNQLIDGNYKLVVKATNDKKQDAVESYFTFGKITTVRFRSDGTKLVVNGREVTLDKILDVFE